MKTIFQIMLCTGFFLASLCIAQQKLIPLQKAKSTANPSAQGCMKVRPETMTQGAPLVKAETEFCLDVAKRGVEGWVDWFAENGSELQDKPVTGKAAVREAMKGFLETPGLVFYWYATKAEIFPSGDTGFTSGRYHFDFIGRTANSPLKMGPTSPSGRSRKMALGKCSPIPAHPMVNRFPRKRSWCQWRIRNKNS